MSRKTRKTPVPKKTVTAAVTGDTRPADVFAHVPDFGALLGLEPLGPAAEPTAKELKAEQAAAELLGKSPRYMVGTVEQAEAAMRGERISGRLEGMIKGRLMPRTAGELRVRQEKPALSNILQEVFIEAQKAIEKHGPMHSPHEGLGVIMEEFDELKDEVYADRGKMLSARHEAVQLAAMAVRYILNVNPR